MNRAVRSFAVGITLAASTAATNSTAIADTNPNPPAVAAPAIVASTDVRIAAIETHLAAIDRRLEARESQAANGLQRIGRTASLASSNREMRSSVNGALTVGDMEAAWTRDFDRTFNTPLPTGG